MEKGWHAIENLILRTSAERVFQINFANSNSPVMNAQMVVKIEGK